jgi:exodeoxyribonuclease VII large subunit
MSSQHANIPNAVFTVSRLNQSVRQLLEMEMGQIWLSGEISNFSQPASGHWYFTLKDAKAQVRCAMFKMANQRVGFRPQNGQQILLKANITLYEPRGDYQLIVENMHQDGDGLLQQRFEQLKQQLSAEGLFDSAHKRPLPAPAQRLGVITSSSGAALHDILQILQRRDPALPVIIYPTAVQGADATKQIVRAIELANLRAECDVLIVGRGGGSLEDLWCFNEESVARAIYQSRIPIVSAVGHEVDVTIADFVADLRAPTPSAAAEMVSRNQNELHKQLLSSRVRLEMAMDYYLAQKTRRHNQLLHRLQQQHPELRLSRQHSVLIQLQQRLQTAIQYRLQSQIKQNQRLQQRLIQVQPQKLIYRSRQQVQQQEYRLRQAMTAQLNQLSQRFQVGCSRLEAVSPLATLARGYSVTTLENGKLVKSSRQVEAGDTIKTRLSEGWITSTVNK